MDEWITTVVEWLLYLTPFRLHMLPNSTVIDILSCLVLSFQPGKVSLGLISVPACCKVKNLEAIGFINVSWKSPL